MSMMILPLLGWALAADTGDTSSCGGMLVPGATYNRATYMCECTAIDEFCAEYFGGTCPTWNEVSAGGWDNADCGAGSTLEHVASQETNEWITIVGFDGTGVLVWADEWHGNGGLWCCEGVASDSIVWGVPATCLPVSGDTAGNGDSDAPKSTPCGCSAAAPGSFVSFTGMALAVAVLRRARGRTRDDGVSTISARPHDRHD